MTIRVYLDANMFIEAFENEGPTADVACAVFEKVSSAALTGVISELIMAELLVKPLRSADQDLVNAYSRLIYTPNKFVVCPVDRDTLIEAARHRAANPSTKLPDAIHIATARLQKCKIFLTTETRLRVPHDLIRLNLDASTITELQALA